MFKILKYLFVANVYKKVKKELIIFTISLFLLLLSSAILNDIITVTTGVNLYALIVVKWVVVLLLFAYIFFIFVKIVNVITSNPFKKKKLRTTTPNEVVYSKREYILNKDVLLTQTNIILQKYKES